jgi:starvation-inducible DNA-binding protein
MDEVVERSKVLLGNMFVFYMKAHAYHWNYIGPEFPQYHAFFGDLYESAHDEIDVIAEHIRQMDNFAPASLARMIELSEIKEDTQIVKPEKMFKNLFDANEQVLSCLDECYRLAGEQKAWGWQNYVQDLITAHRKHRWMLRATLGEK